MEKHLSFSSSFICFRFMCLICVSFYLILSLQTTLIWFIYPSIFVFSSYRHYCLENAFQLDCIQRHLLAFSLGYFFYDTWLSACKLGIYPGRGEIIGHHFITSIMLGIVLLCPWSPFIELLPLCSVGLVIEFNNVFIHIRSLFELAGMKFSFVYRANSILVLGKVNSLPSRRSILQLIFHIYFTFSPYSERYNIPFCAVIFHTQTNSLQQWKNWQYNNRHSHFNPNHSNICHFNCHFLPSFVGRFFVLF